MGRRAVGRGRAASVARGSATGLVGREQIAANKVAGVRAVLAWSQETATLGRQHNDANVIAIGARQHSVDDAVALVEDVRGERELLRTTVPWVAGGVGGLLLAVGALLVARSRPASTDSAEDEPVRVPVPTA